MPSTANDEADELRVELEVLMERFMDEQDKTITLEAEVKKLKETTATSSTSDTAIDLEGGKLRSLSLDSLQRRRQLLVTALLATEDQLKVKRLQRCADPSLTHEQRQVLFSLQAKEHDTALLACMRRIKAEVCLFHTLGDVEATRAVGLRASEDVAVFVNAYGALLSISEGFTIVDVSKIPAEYKSQHLIECLRELCVAFELNARHVLKLQRVELETVLVHEREIITLLKSCRGEPLPKIMAEVTSVAAEEQDLAPAAPLVQPLVEQPAPRSAAQGPRSPRGPQQRSGSATPRTPVPTAGGSRTPRSTNNGAPVPMLRLKEPVSRTPSQTRSTSANSRLTPRGTAATPTGARSPRSTSATSVSRGRPQSSAASSQVSSRSTSPRQPSRSPRPQTTGAQRSTGFRSSSIQSSSSTASRNPTHATHGTSRVAARPNVSPQRDWSPRRKELEREKARIEQELAAQREAEEAAKRKQVGSRPVNGRSLPTDRRPVVQAAPIMSLSQANDATPPPTQNGRPPMHPTPYRQVPYSEDEELQAHDRAEDSELHSGRPERDPYDVDANDDDDDAAWDEFAGEQEAATERHQQQQQQEEDNDASPLKLENAPRYSEEETQPKSSAMRRPSTSNDGGPSTSAGGPSAGGPRRVNFTPSHPPQ